MLIQADVENFGDFLAICGNFGGIKTPMLIVAGSVEVPTPCYEVSLKYHTPLGFNPKILLLDLIATNTSEVCIQKVTCKNVGFSMVLVNCSQYDQVQIVQTGEIIDINKCK